MAKPTGFIEYDRLDAAKRPAAERVGDFREFAEPLSVEQLEIQAARCMDCGIPHCHAFGCPVLNRIPDFNEMIYRGQWRRALEILHATNNLPEITGRICPAPCEAACTVSINGEAVSIKQIELQIVERGWAEGWIAPRPAGFSTGRRVAIIGSGPAGLAAAQQLARRGHEVVVFERSPRVGGLLRYGIPDFKLEKSILDRRLDQMTAEGVIFEANVEAGVDLSARYLRRSFDAILLTAGATKPRDLDVSGRQIDGVHFAMDYLTQQNRRNEGTLDADETPITALGKHVVVIGGGDTGSDCVGTANRQHAASVTQIELLPKPPDERTEGNPWPTWPLTQRTSTSHEEGCRRLWSVATKECLAGDRGSVRAIRCAQLEWTPPGADGRRDFTETAGGEFEIPADLVLLAMGFMHVEHGPLIQQLALATDPRGNLAVNADFMTDVPGVFAAGDAVGGASLVVRAIYSSRCAAAAIDTYLQSL